MGQTNIGWFIFLGIIILIVIAELFSQRSNDTSLIGNSQQQVSDTFSRVAKLHWSHMPITYSFASANINTDDNGNTNIQCPDYQIKRTQEAFDIIQNETNRSVFFNEISSGGDIISYCYTWNAETSGGWNIFTLGDASKEISDNIITSGTLRFYTHNQLCPKFPEMEIHEILHVLGYEHVNDSNSIMNPMEERCVDIDKKIIYDLMSTYYLPPKN